MLKKKSGITLIALVITIIVLLILAGISIQMVVAKNGVIGGATDASEETRDNEEGERVKLAVDDSYLEGKGTLSKRSIREALSNEFGEEKVTDETLIGEEEGPWTFKGERKTYKIDEYGEVDEYIDIDNDTDTGTDSNADISKYVDVGDYVDYHPTYMDKNGKSLVSEDKLTYKSKKGEGSSHGNGSKEQVFKATENEKWRVLDIKDDGTLEIISENIISNDSNG